MATKQVLTPKGYVELDVNSQVLTPAGYLEGPVAVPFPYHVIKQRRRVIKTLLTM